MPSDPTYPDVREMPVSVLAAAILLANQLRAVREDEQIKRRQIAMLDELVRRNVITSYGFVSA